MDDTPCHLFFRQPASASQRLYEALHAVFVDGSRQKDAAERFGYSFDAFRQQVHQFRAACAAGQPPPFSARGRAGGRRPPRDHRGNRSAPPSRTAAS
jgi:hypothetical protein